MSIGNVILSRNPLHSINPESIPARHLEATLILRNAVQLICYPNRIR